MQSQFALTRRKSTITATIDGFQAGSAATYNQIGEVEAGISPMAAAIAHMAAATQELRLMAHSPDEKADAF